MHWNPDAPLEGIESFDANQVNVPVRNDGSYRPIDNRHNDSGIDRAEQKLYSSTGIKGIGLQDSALQETMGSIVDRSRETLASGDAAIVAFRKLMLSRARHLRETGELPTPTPPELYRVRSAGIVLPKGVDFEEGAKARMAVA
jgi:hypothetical protein